MRHLAGATLVPPFAVLTRVGRRSGWVYQIPQATLIEVAVTRLVLHWLAGHRMVRHVISGVSLVALVAPQGSLVSGEPLPNR
jgi:hypothetical protein